MKSPKLQRWIDLLAALLRRRFPVTLEELSPDVPAYAVARQKTALRRTFERDKDELRAFGIPIETVTGPEGERQATGSGRGTSISPISLFARRPARPSRRRSTSMATRRSPPSPSSPTS